MTAASRDAYARRVADALRVYAAATGSSAVWAREETIKAATVKPCPVCGKGAW